MKIDMSPQAITLRLNQVEDLRRLCLSLGKAKVVKDGRNERDDRDTKDKGEL